MKVLQKTQKESITPNMKRVLEEIEKKMAHLFSMCETKEEIANIRKALLAGIESAESDI